ncbi:hypothetical protein V6N11_051527 [Hibiscus sabdariffa]|uniref:Endonuclease/exonuclease/phosphatase domain-containing protein n=1 Tax=Hibiscus sabdariffa TaxID=183260 RepID=A0ABR2U7C3_9ROSI
MLSFPPYILDGSICADSDRPPKNLVPPMHLVSFPSLERPASPLFEADLQLVKRDKADHLVSDVVADGCMEINDQPAKGRGVTGLSDETSIALEPGTTLFSRSYVGVISSIGNETVLDPVPSLDDLVLWDVDVIVDASGSFPSVSFSESFHECVGHSIRHSLIVRLLDLRPGGEASWLLGGDFNSILRLEERDRGLVHGNGVNRPPQFEDFLWDNWDVSRDVEANIQVFADELEMDLKFFDRKRVFGCKNRDSSGLNQSHLRLRVVEFYNELFSSSGNDGFGYATKGYLCNVLWTC